MTNKEIANSLRAHARSVEVSGSNLYQRRAYRAAADAIERLLSPVQEILSSGGRRALEQIPGIGISLAYTIDTLLQTGLVSPLEPSVGHPSQRLRSLPGIGHRVTERIRGTLGITTPGELKERIQARTPAAEEEILKTGIGAKRLAALRAHFAEQHDSAA